MKRFGTKTSKRIVAVILAVFAACSVMGCSVEKTITNTETHIDENGNKITTTSTQTMDKNKAVVGAVIDEELPENPGFFETDSWSIKYDTDQWYGYVNEKGNTIINYLGECAGTSLIEISEVDVPTAKEAIAMIEEKTGTKLTVSDDLQIDEDKGYFAYVAYEEYNPEYIYIDEFYTIYEHDGKVIILNESITHDFDDSRAEALADIFLEQKNALVLK